MKLLVSVTKMKYKGFNKQTHEAQCINWNGVNSNRVKVRWGEIIKSGVQNKVKGVLRSRGFA